MQPPRPALRTRQVRLDRSTYDLEAEPHARQQSIELIIAEFDLAREDLADAGLTDPTDPGQARLGGARFEHHLTKQVAAAGHQPTIALVAIVDRSAVTPDASPLSHGSRCCTRRATGVGGMPFSGILTVQPGFGPHRRATAGGSARRSTRRAAPVSPSHAKCRSSACEVRRTAVRPPSQHAPDAALTGDDSADFRRKNKPRTANRNCNCNRRSPVA